MKELLTVGQIVKTHGIKGEVKVYPLTDDSKRFRKLKKVYIDEVEFNVLWCKLQADRVILKLEGIDTMDEAEKYKNKYLWIKREDAVRLPRDTYFIADLVGCMIKDTSDKEIGIISEVIKTGSNDVYWIKGKKDILIPAIKDIVLNIDIENQTILIKPLGEWQDED